MSTAPKGSTPGGMSIPMLPKPSGFTRCGKLLPEWSVPEVFRLLCHTLTMWACESPSHRDTNTAETGTRVSEVLVARCTEKSIFTRKTTRTYIMMLKNHRFASSSDPYYMCDFGRSLNFSESPSFLICKMVRLCASCSQSICEDSVREQKLKQLAGSSLQYKHGAHVPTI